jgi:hypothetical protein
MFLKRYSKLLCLTFYTIIYLSISCCSESPTESKTWVDSGSWYETGNEWPHDGNPYESEHFIVYSDAASEESRQILAEIGEELFIDLKEQFNITDDAIFIYPDGRQKIHIYAYKDRYQEEWGGWGYYGGFIIWSLDHPRRGGSGPAELNNYKSVVKHELMHIIESLIKGDNDPNLVDVWITEGIAEMVAGGTSGGEITDLAKFNDLLSTYGPLNPIAMHQYRYPDDINIIFYYYYPMFQLAITYLLDAEGHGKTMEDLKNLFFDARDGVDFEDSFENHFGISLIQYEEQFFNLMRNYLN